MNQLLRNVSIGSKFAVQTGGALALSAVAVAGLTLAGGLRLEVAQPQWVGVGLGVAGALLGGWTYAVARSAARPLKEVLGLAQTMAQAAGPAPFAVDRGDEATRLMRHLAHVQEQQGVLARAMNELQDNQQDQQEEMSLWATDSLRLRAALDAAQIDALVTDESGVILFVTRSLADMLQVHQDKIKAVLPHVDLARLVGQKLEAFAQAADGADLSIVPTSDVETQLCFAGLTFALRAQCIRDRHGELTGHVLIWRDLTTALAPQDSTQAAHAQPQQASPHQASSDQAAADQAPADQAQRLDQMRQVLDLSITPTHVVDMQGRITLVNQAFADLLVAHAGAFQAANASFSATEPVGQSAGMFYSDPQSALAQLRVLNTACQARQVLGGRTYDVTHTPMRDAEGCVNAILCQWMDCTQEWLAECALRDLSSRVAQGDYSKPAVLDGLGGIHLQIAQQVNRIVASMNDTVAPVRDATEQLSNALAHVSQSTLTLQQAIESVARQAAAPQAPASKEGASAPRLSRPNVMLAEKAGALLAQMVPAINHTSELLQDAMNPQASQELAATAEQLQAQASLLQAMVASYRLATGGSRTKMGESGGLPNAQEGEAATMHTPCEAVPA